MKHKTILHLKALLIVIVLSIVHNETMISQVTFVNDVEKIEPIVINYRVNNEGIRENIEINNSLTTYKDESWQQGCIDHFKKGKLIAPLSMINEDWKAVYYFVNPKYKTKSLPIQDREKCKQFHTGTFAYGNITLSNVKIHRRKNRQIEKGGDKNQRQVYNIIWTDDHTYILETLKLPLAKDESKVGRIIKVEIIEIIDDNSYLYRSTVEEIEQEVYGVIHKVG